MFQCILPPAFLTEWPGSFTCHWGNKGVERTSNESAHKVNSGEENSTAAPAGMRTCNLSLTSPALYQQAIRLRSFVILLLSLTPEGAHTWPVHIAGAACGTSSFVSLSRWPIRDWLCPWLPKSCVPDIGNKIYIRLCQNLREPVSLSVCGSDWLNDGYDVITMSLASLFLSTSSACLSAEFIWWLVGWIIGTLCPVDHKGSYQG